MTVTDPPPQPIILLSDKLMVITNLNNLIPVKLDVDEMNYSSWVYFVLNLCRGNSLLDHLMSKTGDDTSTNTKTPPDAEWPKVDTIILSWIFVTVSKTLQQRLVVENPQTAKQAWDILADIFHDNKRTRSIALKAELRSIKLGDMTIDAYFRKIESIATILTSLGSPMNSDDVVTFALESLPSRYDSISTIIAHREPFPDLKTVRSMLTTEEMRLKSRGQDTFVDTTLSSQMALLTNTGPTARRSSSSAEKIHKPCFNFNKGSCRFGTSCKFLHNGVHGLVTRTPSISDISSSSLSQMEIKTLQTLLAKLGTNNSPSNSQSPKPVAFYTQSGQPTYVAQPTLAQHYPPPGFTNPPVHHIPQPVSSFGPGHNTGQLYYSGQQQAVQIGTGGSTGLLGLTGPAGPQQGVHSVQLGQGGSFGLTGLAGSQQVAGQQLGQQPSFGGSLLGSGHLPGQETLLPHTFATGTLQDPASGNWNMDTGLPNSSGAAPL